jgi:hypothetical protein
MGGIKDLTSKIWLITWHYIIIPINKMFCPGPKLLTAKDFFFYSSGFLFLPLLTFCLFSYFFTAQIIISHYKMKRGEPESRHRIDPILFYINSWKFSCFNEVSQWADPKSYLLVRCSSPWMENEWFFALMFTIEIIQSILKRAEYYISYGLFCVYLIRR